MELSTIQQRFFAGSWILKFAWLFSAMASYAMLCYTVANADHGMANDHREPERTLGALECKGLPSDFH
jgi:hypothetical protein